MTRFESLLLHLTTLVLVLTGLGVAYSRYLLPHDDPFSVTGSRWEPWALSLHVLAAPAFVFAVGFIYRRHVLAKLKDADGAGRRSGLLLATAIALTASSGYLLQVLTGESPRRAASITHLLFGGVLALGYGAHARLRFRAAAGDLRPARQSAIGGVAEPGAEPLPVARSRAAVRSRSHLDRIFRWRR